YPWPYEFLGRTVTDVLLSGQNEKGAKLRRQQKIIYTLQKRPDLLEKAELSEAERKFAEDLKVKLGRDNF
ncbi:MAG: tRNA (guanosine(37)-N1)-methyltransferase TrmD, partial [Eubacterium sp.]|nr:tRNA (guanosine(37)-N1)-methyltransferase TrmD [Eubacterium sp.]